MRILRPLRLPSSPALRGGRRRWSVGAVALLGLLALEGCGYRFTRQGEGLPEGVRWVAVPLMRNATPEPGLEMLFTQALRAQASHAGVDPGPGTAPDAELQGSILNVGYTPTAIGQNFRLHVTVHLQLVKAGQVLTQTTVSGSEDFLQHATPDTRETFAPDPILQPESNRQVAMQRLAETLMRDGYERIASSF